MGSGGGVPVRVSQNGGQEPVWSRNGRELFYLEGDKMMVAVEANAEFTFRPSRTLFEQRYYHADFPAAGIASRRSYDVAPDGRFLMIPLVQADPGAPAPPSSIVVVQNWIAELQRLVSAD